MIGKTKRIRMFMGKIPKKSDTNFTFGGIALHHRGVKDETLLVHVDSKAIFAAFPYGTKREVILEAIARNHDKMKHFIAHPESYELIQDWDLPSNKKKVSSDGDTVGITMDTYSDGSCVVPSKVEKPVVEKKSYNLNNKEEW